MSFLYGYIPQKISFLAQKPGQFSVNNAQFFGAVGSKRDKP